jgi:hypothetical protein
MATIGITETERCGEPGQFHHPANAALAAAARRRRPPYESRASGDRGDLRMSR